MSAGNQIVPVRIDDGMMAELLGAIASANLSRVGEPYTVSAWIRQAIRDKLSHLQRAKRRCPNAGRQPAPQGE